MTNTYFIPELNKELPRVTDILKVLAKGEAYENWLRTNGQESKTLLRDAGDFGTNIHNHIESIGKGVTVNLDALKPKERRCVEAFLKWKEENVSEFVATEMTVWHERLGYAGTLDAIVKDKLGRLCLLDYKTSRHIYDTYDLQVMAYKHAYESLKSVEIDKVFILRFSKFEDEKQDLEIKEVTEFEHLFFIFCSVLSVWKWKNKKGG